MIGGNNSEAIKDHIAKLRRERRAALGIAMRAEDSARMLRYKAADHRREAERLAHEIEALGGKVRRP